MVDEGSGPEPELRTILARGVHDAEVVLSVSQQHVLLTLGQLGDAAHQVLDLVVSFPVRQHAAKGLLYSARQHTSYSSGTLTHLTSWKVKLESVWTHSVAEASATGGGAAFSPFLSCHNFSSILLRRVSITGENLEAAVGGKHPQIDKHLRRREAGFQWNVMLQEEKGADGYNENTHMLLEELFLSFCLVKKQVPGPVSRYQSPESFLQVIVFLEALYELLQLLLPSLDWTKPAGGGVRRGKRQTQKKVRF